MKSETKYPLFRNRSIPRQPCGLHLLGKHFDITEAHVMQLATEQELCLHAPGAAHL
ncbi:MAG: hypothetical protein AAFQ22_07210 [Pseudomonadota bacterium]